MIILFIFIKMVNEKKIYKRVFKIRVEYTYISYLLSFKQYYKIF